MFNLFIDDKRDPDYAECVASGVDPRVDWHVARNVAEAKALVLQLGMPTRLALDHDLGETDGRQEIVPEFLQWLAYEFWVPGVPVPAWTIHSSNPCGVANMQSFMQSWVKSI